MAKIIYGDSKPEYYAKMATLKESERINVKLCKTL